MESKREIVKIEKWKQKETAVNKKDKLQETCTKEEELE